MPLKGKAVHIGLFIIVIALVGLTFAGCGPGKVVEEFKPQEVKVEPYTPEPEWDSKSDPFMTNVQTLKVGAGQAVGAGTAAGTTTVSTGTGAAPGTPGGGPLPTPPPAPSPTPGPVSRTPSSTDPIYGTVIDRIEGGIIPGALVTLFDRRDIMIDTFITNSNGEFSFINISPGYYKLTAEKLGYDDCPLSTRYIYYLAGTSNVRLELVYAAPVVKIEGGNFSAQSGHVMQTYFYASSTQTTYNSALFDEIPPDPIGTAWVEYDYTVAPPVANKYSYDGLWFKSPDSYHVDSGVWAPGGFFQGYYWSWYQGAWIYIFDSSGTSFIQPNFDAVNPTTGQISFIILASDSDPWVLTTAELDYDYHKDTVAPTMSETFSLVITPTAPGSVRISAEIQENAYTTIVISDTSGIYTTIYYPVRSDNIYYFDLTGLPADTYTYTIQLADQAGNFSGLYSGVPFTIN